MPTSSRNFWVLPVTFAYVTSGVPDNWIGELVCESSARAAGSAISPMGTATRSALKKVGFIAMASSIPQVRVDVRTMNGRVATRAETGALFQEAGGRKPGVRHVPDRHDAGQCGRGHLRVAFQ